MDSIILRGKVLDRRQTVAALQTNLAELSVSYSWDGLGKFNDTLFCGQNKTEKTIHRLFAFNHPLPDSGIAKFEDVDTAARLHARSRNVELGLLAYKSYLVTENTINIAKKDASTAKWRAIVVEPNPMLSFAKGTCEVPETDARILHIFYGEINSSAADLANLAGGSGAVNESKFRAKCHNIADMLVLNFNDSKGLLPPYVERFKFKSSASLKLLFRAAVDKVVDNGTLGSISTG